MMIKESMRRFSTRPIVDKLFNTVQSSSHHEKQIKLGHLINTYLQQEQTVFPNLVNDVIRQWAIEQPRKDALWTCDTNNNECEKFTFNDLYKQSSRLANVLTGKEFNLTAGKTVLVILPYSTPERILLQLACSQSGLVYCPYDPKDLTNVGISQRIQKLDVDCIITNEDNLEIARRCTHNPLRPLKKGLITKCSTSEPLPVGWNHLMQNANNAESEYTKGIHIHPDTPVLRFLSNNNQVIQYSQKYFNLQLVITALWLNSNKTSRLIWVKNQNDIISIAPWIFGSSIFFKETENLQPMFNTFEKHPIDTLCASSPNYQMLENQQQENKTHLTQLFSTEPLDLITKKRWHSMTNLQIRDDYGEFNNPSILNSSPNHLKQKTDHDDVKYSLGDETVSSTPIPLKKFVYQYPINQKQVHGKLARV